MANLTFSSSATLAISGITPTAGPTSTVKVNASFTGPSTNADDRVAETFVINASTGATVIDLSKIVSGKALWLESDGPIHVTLTQDLGAGPVDNIVRVEKFMYLHSTLTAIKVSNPSATTAVRFSVIVPGDRVAVGGGAGVF